MDLSTAAIIEKNKVSTDGVWLLLLEIKYKNEDPVRLVNNTEQITFRGKVYYPFFFELSSIKESGTEIPDVTLTVSNITGSIQALLEEYNGAGGADVTVKAINTNVPGEVMDEEHFKIVQVSTNRQNVSIKLGSGYSLTKRFPETRVLKDFCPFKFKGIECGYTGSRVACNKTLSDCRKCKNSQRFGGAPTIPQGGLYVRNH